MIETIFYFAPDYGTYYSNWESGNISARTICFVPKGEGLGDIYKNGVKYGNTISETQLLEKIQEKIADIPFASTSTAGIVKLGKGLKAVGTDGTVDVDFSGINDLSGLDELVEKILKDLVKDGVDGKDGLDALDYKITSFSTTTNGLNLTQGDKFNQTVDLTNVVKGIVSAWFQNPSDPTLPDFSQKDYSITAFGKNGTSLFISQNNNTQKSVDIQDMVKSSIQNLITNGDTIFNTIGSVVAVNPILTSGTQIATITVDGVTKTLYAPTGTGGGGGTEYVENPYDDTALRNAITDLQNRADKTEEDLEKVLGETEEDVRNKIKSAFATYEDFINYYLNSGDTTPNKFTFGTDDANEWASQMGLITKNSDGTYNVGWSTLTQSYNSLKGEVDQIKANQSAGGEIDYEALSSGLYAYIDENAATSGMDSTWGKFVKNGDGDIEFLKWFRSGVDTYATDGLTYSNLVSSAKDYLTKQSAIARVITKVENVDGDLVSSTSIGGLVETEVNNSLSEIFTENSSNEAVSGLYSRLKKAENDASDAKGDADSANQALAGLQTKVTDIDGKYLATADLVTVLRNNKDEIMSASGLDISASINNAKAELSSLIEGVSANVSTAVKKDPTTNNIESEVRLNADQIYLDAGTTWADVINANEIVSGIVTTDYIQSNMGEITIDADKIKAAAADVTVHSLVTEGGNGTLMIDGTNGLYLEGVEAESRIKMDGSGYFADGNISWDTTGAVKIKGELSAATGTFSGALSGATGTFSGEITATSGTVGGLRISESKLSGEKSGSGVEIEPGKVLVYNPANTQTSVSMSANQVQLYNVPLDVHAGAYLQSADIRKLIVLGESMQFGPTIVLPSQPEQGQIVFCINCKSVSASHTIYGASGDSNGTSTSWDTGQSRIFVFYYNAWYEFFCA